MKNKIVMITGGAGRMGASFAKAIVSAKGKVVLIDTNKKKLFSLKKVLGKENCITIVADAGNKKDADYSINKTLDQYGKLDAAIHSAYPHSSEWGASFENLNLKYLKDDLTRQLGGAIIFSQRVLNHFKAKKKGNLIHISSIMGVTSPKFENYKETNLTSPLEYSAIKAGLIAITKYLSKYYKGNNIRVNCISPGGILDNQPLSFINRYRACCNDKGMLDANDLVGTILFLLSDKSKYITGQNIIIDDGWTL
jgi:NAD(P)-dependent dehydrogenase (short-subunit alcohol dehydrogenase family)